MMLAAPIIEKDSIDFHQGVPQVPDYDKGDADYINCAMNEEEFDQFLRCTDSRRDALALHDIDKEIYFEGLHAGGRNR